LAAYPSGLRGRFAKPLLRGFESHRRLFPPFTLEQPIERIV
jgi:hypothetical protein